MLKFKKYFVLHKLVVYLYQQESEKLKLKIMTTTGNIITKIYGQNTFTFNVGEIITKKGSKKFYQI